MVSEVSVLLRLTCLRLAVIDITEHNHFVLV